MNRKKKIISFAGILLTGLLVGIIFLMPKLMRNTVFLSVFPLTSSSERQLLSGFDDRQVIKIGIAGPIEDIKETNLFLEGINMAVSECNAAGMLPVPVELVLKDDHNKIADVLTIAGDFSGNAEIIAVIGHWGSEFSVAAAQIYENSGVIMLTPVSTNPRLTERDFSLIFRNAPTDIKIADFLADYVKQQGYRNIAALYSGDMTGIQVAHSFESRATKNGVNIIDKHTVYYDPGAFDKNYDKWRQANLNAVFIADIITRNEDFQKRLVAKNPSLPILATDAYNYDAPLQELAEKAKSLHVVTFFNPTSGNETYKSFCTRFTALYKAEPDYWALQGYDSLTTLIEAIKRAGSCNAEDIAAVLKNRDNPFSSITGRPISFDEKGDAVAPGVYIKQIIDGNITYWEEGN